MDQASSFCDRIYSSWSTTNKLFVTLTYAQSLDGMIAKKGQQVLLSDPESMAMTHRLRLLHDGILVGIGTALTDDPQLTARQVPPEDLQRFSQPQPIVIDAHLRLPVNCKLLTNHRQGIGKQPWLIAAAGSPIERQKALQDAGARILTLPAVDGQFDLSQVFDLLAEQGLASLMVEGGASIIQSCLANLDKIDRLIVTIAPKFIGSEGVPIAPTSPISSLRNVEYSMFGKDIVLASSLS